MIRSENLFFNHGFKCTALRQPMAGRRHLGVFRLIFLGMVAGMLFIGIVAARVEHLEKRLEPAWRDKVTSRTFVGPERGTAAMRATVGGNWLSVDSTLRAPVKIGSVEADPRLGSGFSTARGGPGSTWGPVALPQSAPLPRSAFAGLNYPIEGRPSADYTPLACAPMDFRREAVVESDVVFLVRVGLPRFLRHDKGDD